MQATENRARTSPSESSAEWQNFNFRPADPAWAPMALLERCRTALKAYDPYLDLWWSPMRGFGTLAPGRWRVVCWMQGSNTWDTVFFWEGLKNEYREPSADAMVEKIRRCDMWARGNDLGKLAKELDGKKEAADAKGERTKLDDAWTDSIAAADIVSGKRKSFDMGRAKTPERPRLILP